MLAEYTTTALERDSGHRTLTRLSGCWRRWRRPDPSMPEGIPQRLGVRLDPVEDEVAVLAPRVLGGDAGRLDPTESIVLLADLLSGAAVRRPGGDPPKRGRDDRRGEVVLARVRVPLVWPEAVEALDAR